METWGVYESGLIPGTELQNVSLGWNDTKPLLSDIRADSLKDSWGQDAALKNLNENPSLRWNPSHHQ